jgi:hypothetical protein
MEGFIKALKHAFAVGPAEGEVAPLPESLERFAEEVVRRGMETPAILLLETIRPLSFLSSQVVLAMSPLMSLVADSNTLDELAKALEDRRTVQRLIARIETLAMADGGVR